MDAEFEVRTFYRLAALTLLQAVENYFWTAFQDILDDTQCTFFIRRSTGRLCVDLVTGGVSLFLNHTDRLALRQGLKFLAGDDSETTVIESLTLDQHHSLMRYREFSRLHSISISRLWATVNIGSVFRDTLGGTLDSMLEIAWLPNAKLSEQGHWQIGEGWDSVEVTADGWTRLYSDEIVDTRACWHSRWTTDSG
ncbi:hypothetical protein C8R45DRAFT_322192 [Mycena sanguinolenta]|nr:hypothetical protein C8R45DRAFT_322192 [Mycena sanguinolenta]